MGLEGHIRSRFKSLSPRAMHEQPWNQDAEALSSHLVVIRKSEGKAERLTHLVPLLLEEHPVFRPIIAKPA